MAECPETQMPKFSKEPVKNIDYIVDYYAILEIMEAAPGFEAHLKTQYHKLSKQYHPDLFEHASAEIKLKVKTRYQAIQEARTTLQDPKSKQSFDELLSEFKRTNPKAVSSDGTPIIVVGKESFDIDFLLQNEKWDFQDGMKNNVAQLSGYNELVFNLTESAFLRAPDDVKVKKAYVEQLAHKKAYLDMMEMFAWQDIGVLDFQPPSLAVGNGNYLEKVDDRIQKLASESDKIIERRLLCAEERPLLIYDGTDLNREKDTSLAVAIVKDKIAVRITEKVGPAREVAKQKMDHIQKMVQLRSYEKLFTADSDSLQIFLHHNGTVIATMICVPDENKQASASLSEVYNDQTIEQVRLMITLDKTSYLLELNPELEIGFQLIDFARFVYNQE
jgi:curved DNA-binding protein CbpA